MGRKSTQTNTVYQFLRSSRRLVAASVTAALIAGGNPLLAADAVALDPLLQSAQAELAANDALAAYNRMAAEETRFAGDEDYDYWFGLIAVRAGKPARAVFALERVVAQNPNHAGARLELATAYYQLGQNDAARKEVERLDQLAPPPAAVERLQQLREALDVQAAQQKKSFMAFVRLEAGHDNNVGTWPEISNFIVPINPVNSRFYIAQAGMANKFEMNAENHITARINGFARINDRSDADGTRNAEQFDQDYYGGSIEWNHDVDGRNGFDVGVDGAQMNLDNTDYYKTAALYAQWNRRITETQQRFARLSMREMNFDLDLYDFMQSQLQLGASWKANANWSFRAGVSAAYESNDNSRPGGDSVAAGLNGRAIYALNTQHRVGVDAGITVTDYRSDYLPFEAINNTTNEDRDDTTSTVAIYYDWFPIGELQVTVRADYRDQSSSLDAYDYDKTTGSLAVGYYF